MAAYNSAKSSGFDAIDLTDYIPSEVVIEWMDKCEAMAAIFRALQNLPAVEKEKACAKGLALADDLEEDIDVAFAQCD